MFVARVPALAFGENCWVLAAAAGEECLVVDPGVGVAPGLAEVVREHRLRPAAVLLTHGHVDHTFSVAPVCRASGIPAYLHPGDSGMLADPWLGMGELAAAVLHGTGLEWSEPDDVRALPDGGAVELAGLRVRVSAAPGHSPGSVLFGLDDVPRGPGAGGFPPAARTVVSGDVLFAGSVGRTDLPGGDPAAMARTLRDVVLPLPDDTLVLPGHLQVTTVGRERRANPWLRAPALRGA